MRIAHISRIVVCSLFVGLGATACCTPEKKKLEPPVENPGDDEDADKEKPQAHGTSMPGTSGGVPPVKD